MVQQRPRAADLWPVSRPKPAHNRGGPLAGCGTRADSACQRGFPAPRYHPPRVAQTALLAVPADPADAVLGDRRVREVYDIDDDRTPIQWDYDTAVAKAPQCGPPRAPQLQIATVVSMTPCRAAPCRCGRAL